MITEKSRISQKPPPAPFHWRCRHTWKQSARNTFWCLLGCAMGDFATIFAFQLWAPETNPILVMGLAIINGLLTSITLETIILCRQLTLKIALKTALGMSLVSMVAMELAMNVTDYTLVGAAALTWWSVIPSLMVGFITPWPYNYWRLKRHGKACH
ncbi:MAG: hypothetical protein COA42_14995 [Alteromonadaceae bacterium]|nr:MAG: hypothetical protein COA42_14995 [Alteromonadaceae bacterium]